MTTNPMTVSRRDRRISQHRASVALKRSQDAKPKVMKHGRQHKVTP